jgi:hypothetical protein
MGFDIMKKWAESPGGDEWKRWGMENMSLKWGLFGSLKVSYLQLPKCITTLQVNAKPGIPRRPRRDPCCPATRDKGAQHMSQRPMGLPGFNSKVNGCG